MPVLTYGNETIIRREKERFKIRAVQRNNLRSLLGIRRIYKVQYIDKTVVWIDEGVLQWFGYVERMENDRIDKRVYVREYAGSH